MLDMKYTSRDINYSEYDRNARYKNRQILQ